MGWKMYIVFWGVPLFLFGERFARNVCWEPNLLRGFGGQNDHFF